MVLITHDRLDYTQRTLESFKANTKLPYYLIVVDNASTDGTQKWLVDNVSSLILNSENLYPGKATNKGWEEGLKEYPKATHLMRLDNDMEFKPGWDLAAKDYFDKIKGLGQLGLDHEAIEHPSAVLREFNVDGKTLNTWPGVVGGPNIIAREVWDLGIRYPELAWDDGRNSPVQEDSLFSQEIQNKGFLFGHMTENLVRTFANESNWHEHKDYYIKTMRERGYLENVEKLEKL